MNKIYYNGMLKTKAQELRREMTAQEKKLWYEYLRHHTAQFRRQKQFGRYIVDFYCSSAKLVIELDGAQHGTQEGLIHDRNRTAYLESLGFTVLRFANREVDERFEAVCVRINQAVNACSHPKAFPYGEGGIPKG
ncbi:MAG: endonuclease domain-containing protein [Candidatus Ventricola sp.]